MLQVGGNMAEEKHIPGLISQEIHTLCKEYFNWSEPPIKAVVTAINGNLASVGTVSGTYNDEGVPILQSCFSGADSTLNLSVGDSVLIAFIGGHSGNPVIIGKF